MNFFYFFSSCFFVQVRVWVRLGFLFGLDQFPDYLHKITPILAADQIADTDKERLCVSKIHLCMHAKVMLPRSLIFFGKF